MLFKKKRKRKSWFSLIGRIWPSFTLGKEAKRGILLILLLLIAVIAGLGFLGRAGQAGSAVDYIFGYLFGWAKWSVPAVLCLAAISQTLARDKRFDGSNIIGLFLFLFCFSGLFYFWALRISGGLVGALAAAWLIDYVGAFGAAAMLAAGIIISLLLLLDTSLTRLVGIESVPGKILGFVLGIILSPFIKKDFGGEEEDDDVKEDTKETKNNKAVVKEYEVEDEGLDSENGSNAEENNKDEINRESEATPGPRTASTNSADLPGAAKERWPWSGVEINFPYNLLKNKPKRPTSGNIERNQEIIKRTLRDFGIPVTLGDVLVGPTVTQYTFKPAKGIPVARIKALTEDLALELALHPVRLEAPIPGKPLVGLEVPNQTKVLVTLKEVLQSKKFRDRQSNTMVALGRDITGQVWFSDLAKMPHLLVAGATGSGKSICLHSLITSLLYQNNPDDLKFILIDAKQVELTAYNGLPYLIAPVVTDNKRAIRALGWCLNEMDRRLMTLSEAGSQNIQDYNKKKRFNRMPYLVVVVDELGDLLSTNRREAEGAIIRLGQKARAAGIHMILATQRPSVDILSGLIKANLPGRIAFRVTSSINSKTILDFVGAEKLLGQGDMLFIDPQLAKPIRIQGAYVGKEEVKAVVKYAKKKAGRAKYLEGVTDHSQGQLDPDDEVGDEMLVEAKQMIIETGRASASMLQSRLAIGYPRANRILDILQKQGIVGPSIQNKPRQVLVSRNL